MGFIVCKLYLNKAALKKKRKKEKKADGHVGNPDGKESSITLQVSHLSQVSFTKKDVVPQDLQTLVDSWWTVRHGLEGQADGASHQLLACRMMLVTLT
jgi:hypothetical protein